MPPDPPLLEATIERLERRLNRERHARMEAEAVAEQGLRRLFERQQQLLLLETIATAANQSASVEQALQLALEQICAFTHWPLGHVYLVPKRRRATTLRSTGLWFDAAPAKHQTFRQQSEGIMFSRGGGGLPNRVLESRSPAWVEDVTADPDFLRAEAASGAGLKAGFAFPVLIGREVVAVFEFYSHETWQGDADLLPLMAQIGTQLGRTIERGRSEHRLRTSNASLKRMVREADTQRRASHAKSTLLAVTSHEVRTPLNAMLGLAQALARAPLTPEQGAHVRGILDSGAMLLRLLNTVLDLSKIEAGKAELAPAPFDLGRTLRTIVSVWGPRADEDRIALALDISGLREPCVLVADAGKVEQTLINLISNALKFTPSGGEVLVRASVTGEGVVRLEVLDEGPGVAAADRARIFLPFEQTPVGHAAGGAGLGLAICAANVGLLGGAIAADPRPGRGSRFWFEFPAAWYDGVLDTAEPVEEALDFVRPLRVLAAEDHPANRTVLQVLLGMAPVHLTLVENGEEAVEAARRAPFDLVLMDVNMPVMDGVAALRAIRALGGELARTPIYMLTANTFAADVGRYRSAGATGVLSKPVDVAELFATLREVASDLALIEADRERAA